MYQVPRRVLSFVRDTRPDCVDGGPCYGYTDPCAQECLKHQRSVPRRDAETSDATNAFSDSSVPTTQRVPAQVSEAINHQDDGTSISSSSSISSSASSSSSSRIAPSHDHHHHHHVPTNAFIAIGLQTSLAITLHKFPEGFITYATNHASPSLGFSVFMALFVHNISEGFALALPLYLALKSRARAMIWASALGGLSQPLGAGIAALWLHLARGRSVAPGAVFYSCLFAATAGVMTSVALQLFVESMTLSHNKNLCMFWAFFGMALMGLSGALAGDDCD